MNMADTPERLAIFNRAKEAGIVNPNAKANTFSYGTQRDWLNEQNEVIGEHWIMLNRYTTAALHVVCIGSETYTLANASGYPDYI